MKKLICMIIGLSMLAAVGCEKKTDGVSSTDEAAATSDSIPESEVSQEEATEPDTYAPLATVREREIVEAEEFNYEIYEGHAIITKYNGNSENVEIPSEIGGAPVGEIGFYAFEAKTSLQSVVLPDTVTKICEGAFIDCMSLSSVDLSDGLTEIERGAFGNCTSLSELTIPSTVTRIYEQAFTFCEGLTSLTILNPELKYENWGLEELPQLTVYAPEGSAAAAWAAELGKYSPI